jgi:subtilase family serine protease
MKGKLRSARPASLVAVLAFAALVAVMLVGASAAGAATGPTAHPITVDPQTVQVSGKPGPGIAHFSCQGRPIDGSQGVVCYSPAQIQQAYGYSGLLASGIDGRGKTIVIIDAYANPYLTGPSGDLALEDSSFGLPDPPSFTVLQKPNPVPAFDPNDANQVGWGGEETLDVLWSHVMAPGAKIILAEAASNNDSDLLATTKYVIDHHIGDVISQSFGEAESCMDPKLLAEQHALFAQAVREGYTIFASSGDSGASQFNCEGTAPIVAASTPASDPNVTGVGGTTLAADGNGNYIGETAWTEQFFGCNPPDDDDINCSGGGFSNIYSKPLYQLLAVPGHARGVPDVAYNAGVNGGVLTACSVCNGGTPAFFLFGGTSSGSPQWAALTADADQLAHHDIGNINDNLYGLALIPRIYHSVFNDVTVGNNDVADLGNAGFNAGPGWDPVTGLGTPKAGALIPALAFTSGH